MKPWLFLGVSELAITGLTQAQILPENLLSILIQLPLVAVIIWLQIQNQKWLEHMLEVQRKSLKEIYGQQQETLNMLLAQMESKQNKMSDRIELLTQQVAMFGATLGEAVNIKDVVDRLMDQMKKD